MFDVLLREMATRFGLGEKARDVLAALLALMFDPASGGFDGFVRRLRAGGLTTQLDSWLGRGENQPVNAAAVEAALGAPLVAALAQPAGFTPARMASTLTALLPSVLDKLSPDGVRPVPGVVPAAVAPLIAGQDGFVASARSLWPVMADAPVAHAPAPAHAVHEAAAHAHGDADHHAHDHGPSRDGGMGGRWVVWATLLALLAAAGWWFASIRNPELPSPTLTRLPASTAAADPALPARSSVPTLSLAVTGSGAQISGVVDSIGAKQQLESAARGVFGERLQLDLQTDPALGDAAWLKPLLEALPSLDQPGLALGFSGRVVDLKALPTTADPAAVLARLAPLFASLRTAGLFDPAVRAFAALPEQGLQTADLVSALNLMHVYFESGAHTVREDSRLVLQRAAQVISRAAEGTVIEIGGHTDDRGDAQANRDLSEQRAFAVQEALISAGVPYSRLTARGYGSSRPVADNGTREGRAQNRRIEFTQLR